MVRHDLASGPTLRARKPDELWLDSAARPRASPEPAVQDRAPLPPEHPLVRAGDIAPHRNHAVSSASVPVGRRAAPRSSSSNNGGAALTLSAAVVLVVCALVVAARRQRRRELAIDLIIEGCEFLPLATIEQQRIRLLSERHRSSLIKAFERVAREVSAPPTIYAHGVGPLFHLGVVRPALRELRQLIKLLDSTPPLARVWPGRGASSPIPRLRSTAFEPDELISELSRIHNLLQG